MSIPYSNLSREAKDEANRLHRLRRAVARAARDLAKEQRAEARRQELAAMPPEAKRTEKARRDMVHAAHREMKRGPTLTESQVARARQLVEIAAYRAKKVCAPEKTGMYQGKLRVERYG